MFSEVEEKNIQLEKDAILVQHDEKSVEKHFHPAFVQHNPWAKDGAVHVASRDQEERPSVRLSKPSGRSRPRAGIRRSAVPLSPG
jgi:hypothetical protein